MNIFFIDQIFTDQYPPEAAQWCNENHAYIKEIAQTTEGIRRFQIVAVPEISAAGRINADIATHQSYLTSTDWYVIRFADSGVVIPDDIKTSRANARAEIDRLRAELAALEA